MKKIITALALLSLAACSKDEKMPTGGDVITANDFESMAGWVPDASTISKEHAHSGNYSMRVGPDHEFSLTYKAVLGELSAHKPRGVRLEAWAYLSSAQSSGKLVLVVNNPTEGKDVIYDGIELSEVKDYNKWVKVSKEIQFPNEIEYTNLLACFLWRGGATEPVFVDDVVITALE